VEQKAIFLQHNHHSHRFDFVKLADGSRELTKEWISPLRQKISAPTYAAEDALGENA
jgi:hypothetical protein